MRMMSFLNDFAISLTYPPLFSLALLLCGGLALALRRRRIGAALLLGGCAWSVVWSIPQCAAWLRAPLEQRFPVVEANDLPKADAIVVLGGGSYSWRHRADVRLEDLAHSRLAGGARAWLAGRAPIVVLSGGPGEAEVMAEAIAKLDVPASALVLEQRSWDTRSNALFAAKLAERHGIRRVLLVTSSLHMPRASYWFREYGLEVLPAPVPEPGLRGGWTRRWLPSLGALWRSGRAWKEYAGLLAARMRTLSGETALDRPGKTLNVNERKRDAPHNADFTPARRAPT